MVRMTLYLTEEQMAAVKRLAKRYGITKSQVIRELIDLGRQQPEQAAKKAALALFA